MQARAGGQIARNFEKLYIARLPVTATVIKKKAY
jgi:hypothetical protein